MRVNADFSKRVTVTPEDYEWRPSPAGGVDRMMLDRIGDEVARATTIVRFAPNSHFDAHTHGGGEEYLVLDGVFSDESGNYPAGSYVRNPIGTAHTPHTTPGATILVKLHQFAAQDTEQKVVDTADLHFAPGIGPGIETATLHDVPTERVDIWRLSAETVAVDLRSDGGTELFVLEGQIEADGQLCAAGSWLRLPDGDRLAVSSSTGARLWVKAGHLAAIHEPA